MAFPSLCYFASRAFLFLLHMLHFDLATLLLPPLESAPSTTKTHGVLEMENSPLNRLPAELRMNIFEYVFTYDELSCKTGRWRITRKGDRSCWSIAKELGPTRASKQMRHETLHLLLKLNNLVCGYKGGDFDPSYQWDISPALKDPCQWATDALRKMSPGFISDLKTLELHPRIYPKMSETGTMSRAEWIQLSNTFRALVDVLGPMKLMITLHLQFHYENLACNTSDLDPVVTHSEVKFEVCQGDPTVAGRAMADLTAAVKEKRKAIRQHKKHPGQFCFVTLRKDKVLEQLKQSEQVAQKFIELAMLMSIPGVRRSLVCALPGADEASSLQLQDHRRDSGGMESKST